MFRYDYYHSVDKLILVSVSNLNLGFFVGRHHGRLGGTAIKCKIYLTQLKQQVEAYDYSLTMLWSCKLPHFVLLHIFSEQQFT